MAHLMFPLGVVKYTLVVDSGLVAPSADHPDVRWFSASAWAPAGATGLGTTHHHPCRRGRRAAATSTARADVIGPDGYENG